jgi:hypothetical protein
MPSKASPPALPRTSPLAKHLDPALPHLELLAPQPHLVLEVPMVSQQPEQPALLQAELPLQLPTPLNKLPMLHLCSMDSLRSVWVWVLLLRCSCYKWPYLGKLGDEWVEEGWFCDTILKRYTGFEI